MGMGEDTAGAAGADGFGSSAGGAGAGGSSYGNYYDEYGALLRLAAFFLVSCFKLFLT